MTSLARFQECQMQELCARTSTVLFLRDARAICVGATYYYIFSAFYFHTTLLSDIIMYANYRTQKTTANSNS